MNNSQHVVPNKDGGWCVRKSGASRVTRVFETQSEAVEYASERAKKEHSTCYIHDKDGTVSYTSHY